MGFWEKNVGDEHAIKYEKVDGLASIGGDWGKAQLIKIRIWSSSIQYLGDSTQKEPNLWK